jgi:hypothetical protein
MLPILLLITASSAMGTAAACNPKRPIQPTSKPLNDWVFVTYGILWACVMTAPWAGMLFLAFKIAFTMHGTKLP